jgi:cytidine deaminase
VRASGIPKVELMNRLRPWAASFADPPISHFFVGAVMEGASGALYAGANFEYPGETLAFTVHGEGAATTNAWLHGETGIVSLAVGGVPCGYCRQFLSEFVAPEDLTISMPDGTPYTLATQMPHAFLPSVLGVTTTPFAEHHALALVAPSPDPLVGAALAAAARSHAPYSRTYAGVALRLHDATIVTGRSAENVAFNPGMPPLEAALIMLRLAGRTYADIAAAALVETAGRASMHTATRAVLAAISPAPLTYAQARMTPGQTS